MTIKWFLRNLIAIVLILPVTSDIYSQWSNNPSINTPLCTQGSLVDAPLICLTSDSGYIFAWTDYRNGSSNPDVYIQKFNASGYAQWANNGVVVCSAPDTQSVMGHIVSDGDGGAIVAWRDNRNGNFDVYANRISNAGLPLWGTNGTPICTNSADQDQIDCVSDSAGGAIIIWKDHRWGYDAIFGQRIDGSGNVQWMSNGIALAPSQKTQFSPAAIADNAHGAIIAWIEYRVGQAKIYAQRIDPTGRLLWNSVGTLVSPNNDTLVAWNPQLCGDGNGGAIITFQYNPSGNNDVYAQKINQGGDPAWSANGIAICSAPGDQNFPGITTDGGGGAIIEWWDSRSGVDFDIYAQRVNSNGTDQWLSNGVVVCNASGDQERQSIQSDGMGGAFIVWDDLRSERHIYAQRLNSSGVPQLPNNGLPIANDANGTQWLGSFINDGQNGFVAGFWDFRSGNALYAQRVLPNGVLPTPGTISGEIYYDQNGNGVRDMAENTIPGWKVFLRDSSLAILDSAITDSSGTYAFNDRSDGIYVVDREIKYGWYPVSPHSQNFYYLKIINQSIIPSVDFGQAMGKSISGLCFEDLNGNGSREINEPLLPNIRIRLLQNGLPIDSALTDMLGAYIFSNLSSGTYLLNQQISPFYYQTFPESLNQYLVTLSAAQLTMMDANFGIRKYNSYVTDLSPKIVSRLQSTGAILIGSNFIQGSTNIDFGLGINVSDPVVSSTHDTMWVNVNISDLAALGSHDATVGNQGEKPYIDTGAFTVINPKPEITSVSPDSANRLDSIKGLWVYGHNFVRGEGRTELRSIDTSVTVDSLTVHDSLSATTSIYVGPAAKTGIQPVFYTYNPGPPGGGESHNTLTFVIGDPHPFFDSLAPTWADVRTLKDTINIYGRNFVANSIVRLNDSVRQDKFVGITKLQVVLSDTDLATAKRFQITVQNPANSTVVGAGIFEVRNPKPVLQSIGPYTSRYAGDASFILTANGDGSSFVDSTQLWINGVRRQRIDNAMPIRVRIDSTELAHEGTLTVTLYNPPPGGGMSDTAINLIVLPAVDLTLTMKDTTVNDSVAYTLMVTNGGPSRAHGIIVRDTLPSSVAFVSVTPDTAHYNILEHTWRIDSLNPSESRTILIRTHIQPTLNSVTFINWAIIDSVREFERNGRIDSVSTVTTWTITSPVMSIPFLPTQRVDAGKGLTVLDSVRSNVELDTVFLNYRRGGESEFKRNPMTLINGNLYAGVYSWTMDSLTVTNRGIDYYLDAVNRGFRSYWPAANTFTSIRVYEPQGIRNLNAQPSGSEQTTYRLVSFPMNLDDWQVSTILQNALGPYDPTKWRFFVLEYDSLKNWRYEGYNREMKISSGTAYWLIVREPNKHVGTGPGWSYPSDKQFGIVLEPKWNFIGNPFMYGIPFSNIKLDGVTPTILTYPGTWDTAKSWMKPFEGYEVFLRSSTSDTLWINPVLSPIGSTAKTNMSSTGNAQVQWSMTVSARCQEARDEYTRLLASPAALKGEDQLDEPKPPVIGNYVSVYFPHPESKGMFQEYAVDARPVLADGDVWSCEVRSNIKDMVHLSFRGILGVPTGYQVWLIDELTKVRKDLQSDSTYQFANQSEQYPRKLKVVVGTLEYVRGVIESEDLVPREFVMEQNFPNPFNPATMIKYQLPFDSKVNIYIYNVLGQVVASLVNQTEPAGYKQVEWNASNFASGIYFYRLEATSVSNPSKMFTSVRKMVLIR